MNEASIEQFKAGLNDRLNNFQKVKDGFQKGWDPEKPMGLQQFLSNLEAVVVNNQTKIEALGMEILPTTELQTSRISK